MTDNTNKSSDMRIFLETLTMRNNRAAKLTWIFGLIVVLIVGCYMSTIIYVVHGILDPMTAASMLRMQAEASVPMLLQGLEDSLKMQATDLANNTSKSIQEALPTLRKEAEAQIDLTVTQLLPLMREEIRSTIKAYVHENRDELLRIYQSQTNEEFARAFIAELTSQVEKSLDDKLQAEGGVGIAHIETVTMNSLKDIDESLRTLISKKPENMTHSERLQRKLIASWIRILNQKMDLKSGVLSSSMGTGTQQAVESAAQ